MSLDYTVVTPALAQYIRDVTLREPPALSHMRETKHAYAFAQTSVEQGQLLYLLAKTTNARKCLDIGAFLGYSAAWMASALPENGRVIACEINEVYTIAARRALRTAGLDHKVDVRCAPATTTLDSLISGGEAGTYDLVYVDADKPGNAAYYERSLMLLRQGGIIAIDNVLWRGAVIDAKDHSDNTESIRALNLMLHSDPRVTLSLVTLGDGLTLACKL